MRRKNEFSLLRYVTFYGKKNERISRLEYPSIECLQIDSICTATRSHSTGESSRLVLPSSADCFRIAASIARRVNSISSVAVTSRLRTRSSTTSSITPRSIGPPVRAFVSVGSRGSALRVENSRATDYPVLLNEWTACN